jgi:hypothetical protein
MPLIRERFHVTRNSQRKIAKAEENKRLQKGKSEKKNNKQDCDARRRGRG